MKEDLQKLLEEVCIRSMGFQLNADLLYPPLQTFKCLSQDEVDLIGAENTTTKKILRIFALLKSKSDDVFITLQKVCHIQRQGELLKVIQITLNEFGKEDLIWQPKITDTDSFLTCKDKLVTEHLKIHYKQDLKVIENYWRKFDVCGTFGLDKFYNQKIIIKDKYKLSEKPINCFDDLFTTDYKQFTIVAEAGYGKSTFVHEMAHQWVKGESTWTNRFDFLFLFRLTEVSQNDTQSVQNLLIKCLSINDSMDVCQWLNETTSMEKSLFIFDGLDELQHEFCQEIKNIIFGKGNKLAHVVLTSRPCKHLSEVGSSSLYVELHGYTEEGVKEQLKKFFINPVAIRRDLQNILKVPLFNTLFCITHDETTFGCLNICIAIERFVHFACNRYRKLKGSFTESEEDELIIILGKSAQKKFLFIKDTEVENAIVTPQLLNLAVETGLVYQKSTLDDFIFSHQTVAEYCAAYFWVKTSQLVVSEIRRYGNVFFDDPQRGSLKHNSLFSRFLCHLKFDYKLFLWKNFEHHVPLLDDYESLPKRRLQDSKISLAYIPTAVQVNIMDKIDFYIYADQNCPFQLYDAQIETETFFENLREIKNLQLVQCKFRIDPEVFFRIQNTLKCLFLNNCIFKDCNNYELMPNDSAVSIPTLEYLTVLACDFSVIKILNYIMHHCTSLKTFKLIKSFENATKIEFDLLSNSWITELQNNEQLLQSIENLHMEFNNPIDLTLFFKMIGKLTNLKNLELWVKKRNLTESEVNAITYSVGNKLKFLQNAKIDLRDKNGKMLFC